MKCTVLMVRCCTAMERQCTVKPHCLGRGVKVHRACAAMLPSDVRNAGEQYATEDPHVEALSGVPWPAHYTAVT